MKKFFDVTITAYKGLTVEIDCQCPEDDCTCEEAIMDGGLLKDEASFWSSDRAEWEVEGSEIRELCGHEAEYAEKRGKNVRVDSAGDAAD